MSERLWGAKIWARLHDPAEKALILMRRPGGHEAGSVAALRESFLGDASEDERAAWQAIAKPADWYASAADRPNFPFDQQDPRYPDWATVRFYEAPEVIHPLSGQSIPIETLNDIAWRDAEAAGFAQLEGLKHDSRMRSALALWRFSGETPFRELGALWPLLPADSRTPDHSIFAHLDLVSAFAGAMALDSSHTPALLVVSLGPVQDFIAAARKTTDLWAGSHFLSCLAWEAMKVVASRLGPDSILFPALRGVPIVDAWLRQEIGLRPEPFRTGSGQGGGEEREPDWVRLRSDANPLYTSALPNKFLAVVPAAQAGELGEAITVAVRAWALEQARGALGLLFRGASLPVSGPGFEHALKQLTGQLEGFPEVHWAAAPWLLASDERPPKTDELQAALRPFFPKGKVPFFDLPVAGSERSLWQILSREVQLDGHSFRHPPNRGMLYSEIHRLAECGLASAKALRRFEQLGQEGYRCTLCGERERLAESRTEIATHSGASPLWDGQAPARAKKAAGRQRAQERLCAWCALKRVWPEQFAERVAAIAGASRPYAVSTHTMALAPLLEQAGHENARAKIEALQLPAELESAALPFRLAVRLGAEHPARLLPAWIEAAPDEREGRQRRGRIREVFGAAPDEYFALALLDGDRMGAWVAGEDDTSLRFSESWHHEVRRTLAGRADLAPELAAYCAAPRPNSPARQAALSDALNNFALCAVPFAVERSHNGKVIYAGGDDVLAMLPVQEAAGALLLLRLLYGGMGDELVRNDGAGLLPDAAAELRWSRAGFWLRRYGGRDTLLRMMGSKPGLSGGLVIAHHKAPLGAVLRAAREAEQRAKHYKEGRFPAGALSVALLKRSGGTTQLDLPWWLGAEPPAELLRTGPGLLGELTRRLGGETSRRLVYHLHQRLPLLPTQAAPGMNADELRAMLEATCSLQTARQAGAEAREVWPMRELLDFVFDAAPAQASRSAPDRITSYLLDLLTVAEFLARSERRPAAAAAGGGQ